jgi:hypothetical protein
LRRRIRPKTALIGWPGGGRGSRLAGGPCGMTRWRLLTIAACNKELCECHLAMVGLSPSVSPSFASPQSVRAVHHHHHHPFIWSNKRADAVQQFVAARIYPCFGVNVTPQLSAAATAAALADARRAPERKRAFNVSTHLAILTGRTATRSNGAH